MYYQGSMKNYQIINSNEEIPLISIAILAYNHELYIAEAIEGILMQQTSYPYKIVIAEDCSTDSTREIILKYQQKYPEKFKLILQKKNVGFMQNNIDILSNMEGKYIATCEGDDYWIDPLKLQKQVDFLENNEQYGLICTNYTSNSVNVSSDQNRDIELKDLLKNSSVGTVTALFRKKYIDKYLTEKLNLKLSMGDYQLWIYICSQTKIYKLSDVTAFYRILRDSASGRNNYIKQKKFALDVLQTTKNNLYKVKSKEDFDDILRERYGQLFKILVDSKDKEFLVHQLSFLKTLKNIKFLDIKIFLAGVHKIYFL